MHLLIVSKGKGAHTRIIVREVGDSVRAESHCVNKANVPGSDTLEVNHGLAPAGLNLFNTCPARIGSWKSLIV